MHILVENGVFQDLSLNAAYGDVGRIEARKRLVGRMMVEAGPRSLIRMRIWCVALKASAVQFR